ncbi:diguanylate cyclase [Desulfococcaceae bacterium HSG8]|nr:diguanylate cyclase [Desulfococcaceae bacterium HSG8]
MKEKILIIDDEKDTLASLSFLLTSEGYDVITACDGQEGMDIFMNENPDLVLVDIRMPKKDGLTVLKELEKSGVDAIVLTGYSDEGMAIASLRRGAYDYHREPLEDIDVLIASVKGALYKRNLELKNKELLRQLEEMVIRDPLTGLYNYRYLHIRLTDEITRSSRFDHGFCVLMIDIDYFKSVNDNYGHLYGDYVLKKLGKIISENIRSCDTIYRYGGEEFLILMPETLKNGAISVISRLMKVIRDYIFDYEGQQLKLTVSIGGANYPDHATDRKELIRHADDALYKAKKSGRNRFCFD